MTTTSRKIELRARNAARAAAAHEYAVGYGAARSGDPVPADASAAFRTGYRDGTDTAEPAEAVIRYTLGRTVEGTLDTVLADIGPQEVTLDAVLASMRELAFIVETVAHLQGKERDLLPTAERARLLIAKLGG